MIWCHHCSRKVDVGEKVGRQESCPHCRWDLHVCRNCQHYDPKAYNECRENQADRVVEKDKSNFCDYFLASETSMLAAASKQDDAKSKLDALFKKK